MSANLTNDSSSSSSYSSSSSLHPYTSQCHQTKAGLFLYAAIFSPHILFVLPLSVFVLFGGIHRWRRQRSVSTAAATSHTDFFTYNMAMLELIAVLGYVFFWCSFHAHLPVVFLLGSYFGSFSWIGQLLFPIITCVERYLAVVHPITYLRLRQGGGVRIRNIATACVWLMCFGGAGLLLVLHLFSVNFLPFLSLLILFLLAMTFLSLSVLRVLIRPRPGKAGGDRAQVDQSKQRAFKTIIAIMAVLWFKFGGNVVALTVRDSAVLSLRCFAEVSPMIFSLPCSLVLPLLFLHRAGKLPFCKHSSDSG